MTRRLYYDDSFLFEFDAQVMEIVPASPGEARPALILDRTAFYPTSGGQACDTGRITPEDRAEEGPESTVVEVSEREDGAILHFVSDAATLAAGARVRGSIDVERRLDHIQQHSGQHVLSAALIRRFDTATVSFHMGEDCCTIDLDAEALTPGQVEAAERLANEVIREDRPVEIRYVSPAEARGLGLRKMPAVGREELRLIAIQDFDLTACGGTHARRTGQIGCILLRKIEKVRQGVRLEFACGQRAVRTARRDYSALAEAAEVYSAHPWDVPHQVRRALEEAKDTRRTCDHLREELAEQMARRLLAETPAGDGRKVVTGVFADRDPEFVRLLARKCTSGAENVIALLASTSGATALVFAQSPGQPFDMGILMKEAVANLGGRGGGGRDLAQGGTAEVREVEPVLGEIRKRLRS